MRLVAVVGLALALATGAFAQGRVFGSASGFGNILYPGTGHAPRNPNFTGFGNVIFPGTGHAPTQRFSIADPSFGARLGASVNGSLRVPSVGRGRGYGRAVYVPYAYPVYVGGSYDQVPPQEPNVVVVYPQQQQQAPIVINHYGAAPPQPMVQEVPQEAPDLNAPKVYEAPSRSTQEMAAAEPPSGYLIAFKDNSIYTAVAYWVEGDTLHYFTSGNTHNQVSLALVDKALTERLNTERGVDIRLPK